MPSVAPPPAVPWTCHANARCLRGLRFDYHAPEHRFERERFLEALHRCFGGALLVGEEQLGRTRVSRVIFQFRFEVRLGPARGAFSVLHRVTASAAERASDRGQIELSARSAAIPDPQAPGATHVLSRARD